MVTANRLHTVEEYYFSKKLREVHAMKAAGAPIINLGIGSPDLAPPKAVISAINDSLADASAHKYQSYQGLPELRSAMADFYQTHYNVSQNPENEVLPLIGSKEGIMHISMAYLNEGDAVLIPNPGYPTYTSVTKLVGAEPVFYDLKASSNWQPDLVALEAIDLSKVKIMWVNYPHMPTGTLGNQTVLKALVDFAKKHSILLINDNPYSFILNDNPSSIFNIEGAKDVCLELNSLSKTFNMAGWRVGMLTGSAVHLQNVIKVKSNMDSGMFYGIQKGAVEALNSSKNWFKDLNKIYSERRALVWELATALNCTFETTTSGMFVWAKLPSGLKSETFIDNLLQKHHIFIAPGTIFGSNGEGYIRFSLCAPKESIQSAINRVL
ncbi:MAG: aminotransferase class I/II-fold pyridoxal phosphate-dependent enzyme [Flavobacteriaceae bacterium]|jgi:LL-diaminopimelate aminotransferase|nr:aminotransferase class I/II-fold pyridoxal phosphate-dependent enzyme [Formosa sp.]MDG1373803.1 aminotransferase class I/II-fold pyridoxal phosphate-dependent enzyme [Flavobacteriaceae bacterium]MDG2499042.1 aminotransferase class I/II-fold pyridoxal phosphate-dependent enzyme [Flavobacteriaceae bacterium]